MDLLDSLNAKVQSSKGSSSEEPNFQPKVSEDITAKVGETGPNSQSSEPEKTVQNPDTWTTDSALKEVIKLREENKLSRLKFQEQLAKLAKEKEDEVAVIKESAKSAEEAKKKLEALEADQADKKRGLEEKLAHREGKLVELETTYEVKLREKEQELSSYKAKAAMYEAEQAAREQVYAERIKEEMSSIPEELKPFAERMVKGFDSTAEAWTALSEAKMKGMFGEKKIVVNHSVPGANDGARQSKPQDKVAKSPRDLIKQALLKAQSGEKNSALS